MADYKIDVRAVLDVSGYKKQLDKITLGRIIDVKLNPTVDFKYELTGKTIDELIGLQDRIQKWFNEPANQIALSFTPQKDAILKQQLESIRDAIRTVAPIDIPVNTDTKKINSLATALTKIGDAYKNIDNNKSIYIFVDSNAEQSQQRLDLLKQQIDIIKETLKKIEPVSINIGFKAEDLTKLYKDITDIQDKLKSLENIEIKPPDNLLDDIKNSIKDIPIKININKEEKDKLEEDIKSIKNKEVDISNINVSINIPEEEKDKLKFEKDPIKVYLLPNLSQLRTFRSETNKWIKENPFIASLIKDDSNLSIIKNNINDYFNENPISLSISEKTEGLDLSSFTEAWKEASETAKQFTADTILEQKIKLQDYFNELHSQRENDRISEEEYAKKLRELTEDTQNQRLLNYKSKGSEYLKIRQELYEVEANLEKRKIEAEKAERDKANAEAIRVLQEKAKKEEEIVEKTTLAWKDSIDKAIQEFENTENLKNFDDAIASIKMFSEQSGVDLKQFFDEASRIRDEYIEKTVQKTQEMYSKESSELKNVRDDIQTNIIDQQTQITDVAINESKRRTKLREEEAEKEIEILQEQVHTHSEIYSSMFEDYNNSLNEQKKVVQEISEDFNFSKIYEKNAKEIEKALNKSFIEDIQNIFRQYKRHTEDFEAYNDDFWKRVALATKQGVSEEVIQKIVDKWNKVADAHQKTTDRINQQQEKADEKAEEERKKEEERIVKYLEKITQEIIAEKEKEAKIQEDANKKAEQERQKEEQRIVKWAENLTKKNIAEKEKEAKEIEEANQKAIKKELENTQDLYNKKLISAEEYVSRMKTILPNAFNAGVDGAQKFQNSVDKVEKELQEAKDKTDSFSNSLKSFGTSSNNLFNSLMRYFGVTQIFSAVQGSFSKMITEVRDLDKELTEFQKVSDLTTEQTKEFIDACYELGGALAKTGTEAVTATTLFKKMGYSVQESMQFAKDALMWTNVADGMVSVEEASTMLISTMKAFGEESISTTHIIDALNEVSNNYSVSSSSLSNNLSAVASTLASSGVEFEEMLGLLTAGIEIMPDKASKVANGLKTISQRIRQIDGATAEKLDDFLGSKGIKRFDETTKQLKSTYDILWEISELWPKLNTNERQYLGEVMAGKNQITVLNAIMTNFKTSLDATATAYDSLNSATEENARVVNSIEGHINNFKKAFEELSKDLINSDLFKKVVDFGTRIIEWIDDIVKNHSVALINAITGIGTALTALQLVRVGSQISNLITVTNGAVTAIGGLNPVLLGIAAAVGVVSAGVSYFVQDAKEAEKDLEELKKLAYKNQEDAEKQQAETEKSIEELINKYDLLNKKRKYLTTPEEKEELDKQLRDIQQSLKNQGIEVDLTTGKYEEQVKVLKEALAVQKEKYYTALKEKQLNDTEDSNPIAETASEHSDSFTTKTDRLFNSKKREIEIATKNIGDIVVEETSRTLDTLKWAFGEYENEVIEINGRTLQEVYDDTSLSTQQKIEIFKNAILNYQELARDSEKKAKEAKDEAISGYFTGQQEQYEKYAGAIQGVLDKMEGNNDKLQAVFDASTEFVKTKLEATGTDIYKFSSESLNELQSIIEQIDLGQLKLEDIPEEYQQFSDILVNTDHRASFLQIVISALNEVLKKESKGMEGAEDSTSGFASSLEKVGITLSGALAAMDDYAEKAQILAQAEEDVTNAGVITAETLKKIADAGLEAYLIFDEETGSLVVNTQAFFDNNAALEDNKIGQFLARQEAQLYADIQKILSGNTDAATTAINSEADSLDEVAVSYGEATKKVAEYKGEVKKLLKELGEGELTDEQEKAINERINQFVEDVKVGVETIHAYFNNVTTARTATSRGASHSGSSSSSSAAEREAQQAQRDAERAQREAEQAARQAQQDWKEAFKIEYNKLKTYLDSELITYEQYYQALEELNQHFFAGRAEFEEEYWKYQDEIVKGRKKYLEDELKDYFQKGEKILKHQLNVEYITEEEYYDALTLLYESYYTDKEKYEEEYWKLEEEIYKLRKKQIKELEDELKDLYKEIEDLHKEYVKSLEDDLDEVETTISFAIDVIDEEIQKLKDEKTAIDEANDAREESIKLQELEDALERARNKKVRVYKKGEGFVYEQDTTAISQAQTALDKYKQEAQHKKRLSNIDEEIKKLEEYKKEWQNISVNYKKAQDEMTAKAILGENAREEVLRREHNAVTKVGNRYVAVKNAIIKANEATIDNLEAYIGDATQAGTFSYEIERIKNKIDEIQSKTVTLQVNTSQASTSVSNIIVAIDALKNKLESQYSTQNLNVWLASYKSMINEAYNYNPSGGYSGGSGSGGDYSGDSGPSGNNPSSGGNNQDVPSGKPAIGTRVRLKQPNNYLYGDQEFEIWGYDYKGDPQIRWVGSSDTSSPTYAVSLSELEGYDENTDTNTVNPGDTITEDGVYKYADQDGNYMPMDVIWEGGQKYYYNPVTGQKIPVVSGGGGESGVYDGGGSSDDGIYYYEPIDWQGQGYQDIGEYYADYRQQMEDYYHNLYGYHASGTTGTTTKKFVINENGIEAMVTPDGTVISAPSTGYGVIKNEYTERLTDFAADPLGFLGRMFTGYSGTYQNNNNAKNEVININGNLTLPNVTDGQSFVDSIRNVALQYTTRRR